jgi:hypothetical protein
MTTIIKFLPRAAWHRFSLAKAFGVTRSLACHAVGLAKAGHFLIVDGAVFLDIGPETSDAYRACADYSCSH